MPSWIKLLKTLWCHLLLPAGNPRHCVSTEQQPSFLPASVHPHDRSYKGEKFAGSAFTCEFIS